MNKAFIVEVGGQWVVLVEADGRRQEYVCESLEQAQRWVTLLGAPLRHHAHGVRARSGA
ncbi:MAG: hypothetical protein Q8L48_30705 [Archangium sp.]|nr:hypothetical protein [Archangium sp.]